MTALAAMTACWADEKTDVTAQYVTNASFEADAIASLEAVNNSADGLPPQATSAIIPANAINIFFIVRI